jgi:hypothetical protein
MLAASFSFNEECNSSQDVLLITDLNIVEEKAGTVDLS